MSGALTGIRVIEIGGLGPAPFCSMVLADHGADVLRIERPDKVPAPGAGVQEGFERFDLLSRSRRSAGVDLRSEEGSRLVATLARSADVLVEGFRPGVAERLGIGPEVLCSANERLIYGRMTGWGRRGPLAERAGHDINYISVAGVQAHVGRAGQPPTPPLNLVGDFGGGGMLLAFGICAALVERSTSGRGQVVDAAMVDGAALLMAPLFGASASGFWSDDHGENLLDSGAPFYDCYRCADDRYLSVGAIEPRFFAELLDGLGIDPSLGEHQNDVTRWPDLRAQIAAAILKRSRDDWAEVFAGRDACVAPVLTMGEAPDNAHMKDWGTFVEVAGVQHPAPAPRFSRSAAPKPTAPHAAGADTDEVLADWGIAPDEIARLRGCSAIA